MDRLVTARQVRPFEHPEDLARRAALDAADLHRLAQADALRALLMQQGGAAAEGGDAALAPAHRHQAAWVVSAIDTHPTALLQATRFEADGNGHCNREGEGEGEVHVDDLGERLGVPAPSAAEDTLADYRAIGLTLQAHPLSLLRTALQRFRVEPACVLQSYPAGRLARASGLVTHRQRPPTAKGTLFITLEDDTGSINVIVWARLVEAQRKPLLAASLLTVYGRWQCQGEAPHVTHHLLATRVVDHTHLLQGLVSRSRDFR